MTSTAVDAIGIVILNWDRVEDTRRCLASLPPADRRWVAYVVNNGCRPGQRVTEDDVWAKRVRILDLPVNRGFTGGVNEAAAIALADGREWLLLLNNDAVLGPGALSALWGSRARSIGALCPTIIDESSGRVSALGGHIDWKRGVTRDLHHGASPAEVPRQSEEVDFGTGAALLISAQALRRVGLLDDIYFAYWEETDWCTRARRAGYSIRTCPDALIMHRGGASLDPASRLYLMVRNCVTFMRRHASKRNFVTFLPTFVFWTVPVWSARAARADPVGTARAIIGAFRWHFARRRLPPFQP